MHTNSAKHVPLWHRACFSLIDRNSSFGSSFCDISCFLHYRVCTPKGTLFVNTVRRRTLKVTLAFGFDVSRCHLLRRSQFLHLSIYFWAPFTHTHASLHTHTHTTHTGTHKKAITPTHMHTHHADSCNVALLRWILQSKFETPFIAIPCIEAALTFTV